MDTICEKIRPTKGDIERRLDYTYRDDEDVFNLLGINSYSYGFKRRLQSKHTAIVVIAMLVIMSGMAMYEPLKNTVVYYAFGGFMVLTIMILEILFILGMNREALKLILADFTFLFEAYQGIRFQCYFIMNDYHLNPNFYWPVRIMWAAETILFSFVISAIDASSLHHNLKWMMTAVLAAAFTACSLTYRTEYMGYGEKEVTIANMYDVATLAEIVSTSQILAIFYWKRTLALFRGGIIGEAACIKYNPYIHWVKPGDESNKTDQKEEDSGKDQGVIDTMAETVKV